ncbi:MAG: TIM barrel protein [Candidatus Micrarchaeota archaeon]
MLDTKIRFGPAGVPTRSKGRSTLEGIECCAEIGLDAMEIEFVRGVKMGETLSANVKKLATKKEIKLSSHAPYYINLCSIKEETIENTKRNLFESAKATYLCGGRITVFHSGYYQELSKEDAYQIAKKRLNEINEQLKQNNIKCVLGAETVGKKSQFGGLDEVIRLSQELENVQPVIDFSHLVARADFPLKTEEDYSRLFSKLEKELPDYLKHFHSHFQEVNYSDKGELNHLILGTKDEPPYKPFIKVIKENGYSGVVICESPIIETDALKMKEYYDSLKGK